MPMSDSDQFYDVFISYSHADKEWVWDWLVPRLKEAGLAVCTDRESFDVGVPALVNMENAVAASLHTLLVLTPAWVQSQWTCFEALLAQHEDPAGLLQCTLPVLRQPCDPPRRIAMFTYADLTGEADDEAEFAKLLDALRGVRRLPDADRLLIKRKQKVYTVKGESTGRFWAVSRFLYKKRSWTLLGTILHNFRHTARFWIFIISMPIIVAFIVIAIKVLLPQFSCQTPISANQVLIRPKQDVELIPYRGFRATGARGIVRNHGGIELGGLAPGNRYYLTLNGKIGIPPNCELCKINCKTGMGYWDFMTVTTNSNGEVSNQTLMAYLPGNVELCPNQVYSAKFFVKRAEPEYEVVLANDDFLFTLEALSSSIPRQLQITISNEVAKDYVKNVSMEVTEASSPLSPTTIKGDSPVTITVQVLDERQNVIPSDELIYSWDLCCPDGSIPPSNPHQSVWRFQPPTYLPTETLTITVSNRMGYSISAVIPFTITER